MNQPKSPVFNDLNKITTEEFFRFLDKNSVTTDCPMCKHNTFLVSETVKHDLEAPQQQTAYVTLFKHDPIIPTEHDLNYYYLLHCEKCGFTTTFSAQTVYKWLTEHSVKENEASSNGK
ncbi:hypothetical protein [Citrobacter amalonaticus]|uniref:hypothetical protein n=1 Tax=Citrobacter amalonaticus TaxID=35703 RepID=UPI003747BB3D|nr:hypothetical protein [Salmonella enterica subsp. enterica serovar Poona]